MESRLRQDLSSQTASAQDHGPGTDPLDVMRQLGSASADLVSAWTQAWGAVLTNRSAPIGEVIMKTFATPAAWPTALAPILDEIRSALKLPTFSDMPGRDLFKLPSPAPLLGLIQVSQEYAAISVPIWIKACERFLAEAKQRQEANGKAPDAGDLLDIWNNVLDLTLMEFNRSDEFARAQKWLLHAAAEQRRELGGAVEKLTKAVDMPTRTEMTDVYRRLHDLTREVHALRRELGALRREPKAAASKRTA
jgi:Poly(R)-hydroxyalkanoic acid synthase subunit (PHA_synth_III_E)